MRFVAPYRIVDTGNLALHFHPDHLADLRASGLADDTIRGAGVYSLRPCDIALFFNARRGAPEQIRSALCFPYACGTFARIKLFPALQKMKYAQPPETSARLYMPFPIGTGDIVVCEGEKKTLAACQVGLNAVGIGGVWNWLNHGQPIDDLAAVEWDGHDVTIIPDSDVFPRVDLLRAIYALGCELRTLGVVVLVARIPQDSSKKVGLDDYLAAGGKVGDLEVFALSHSIFKSVAWWYGKWKFENVLRSKVSQKKEPRRKSWAHKERRNHDALILTPTYSREQTDSSQPKIKGEEVMHVDNMFPNKYLKASDLQGHSKKFTIARVEIEYSDFGDREMHVVYFEDEEKGWPLTKTSAVTIAKTSGLPDSDDWSGVSITLYPAPFKRRGVKTEIIRVEESANGNGSGEPPSNDEIPF